MLEAQLRLLSTEQRAEFYSLADCKVELGESHDVTLVNKVEEGEEKSIDGIWRTNNFALGPSGPRTDNGLFPRISRYWTPGLQKAGILRCRILQFLTPHYKP